MDDDVISFCDPLSNEDNKSPITPAVIAELVDSLEPITRGGREQFTNHYISNKR